MFCQNCGKEIPSDTKFCPSCGTQINQLQESKKTEISNQDSTIGNLKDCLNHFSKIKDVYSFFNTGNNLVNNSTWVKYVKDHFIMGIISSIIGLIVFIPSMIIVIGTKGIAFLFLWEFVIASIGLIICGVILAIIYGKHKSTIKFYKTKLPEIEEKIAEHYQKYENCPLAIGYTDPATIETLISYLNSCRAESLKEAINLFEDECHKAQMITEMKQMKAAAQKAATAATITAINTLR